MEFVSVMGLVSVHKIEKYWCSMFW